MVKKGRNRVVMAGRKAGMTDRRTGERLIIVDHTAVARALRGRKVQLRVIRQAVEMPVGKGS